MMSQLWTPFDFSAAGDMDRSKDRKLWNSECSEDKWVGSRLQTRIVREAEGHSSLQDTRIILIWIKSKILFIKIGI